jgi:hypothetical protein
MTFTPAPCRGQCRLIAAEGTRSSGRRSDAIDPNATFEKRRHDRTDGGDIFLRRSRAIKNQADCEEAEHEPAIDSR